MLLAGPKVANCFVAFLNLIGRTSIPIDGSTDTPAMEIADLLDTDHLVEWFKLNP